MTKYQEWKLYGRYVLRRIRKRIQTLLSRVLPGIAPRERGGGPIGRQIGTKHL